MTDDSDMATADDALDIETVGEQLDFAGLSLVVIHDSWVGYSDISPLVRSYLLRPGPDGGLVGQGRLTTGRGLEKDATAAAPTDAARALLKALAEAEMRPIPYVPVFDHTDDYPRIEIAVHAHQREIGRDGGTAVFHTTSQGEAWSPWAVSVGGKTYVIEGEAIGRAYAAVAQLLEGELREE